MKSLLNIVFIIQLIALGGKEQAVAQQNGRGMKTVTSEVTGKRLALVMGNYNYSSKPLPNARNDAEDISQTLRDLGFEVIHKENLSQEAFEDAVSNFTLRLKGYEVGLFYFAGHGFEGADHINYLMSVEVRNDLNETLTKKKSMSLNDVMDSMKEANSRTNILLVDACRNNPFRSWGRSEKKGLGVVNAPEGTIAFFAASPGQEAAENSGHRNGLFTQELLLQLKQPNLELITIFKNTARSVKTKNSYQTPYQAGFITDDFYFMPDSPKQEEPTHTEPVKPNNATPPSGRSDVSAGGAKSFMNLPFADMAYIEGGTFQMGDTRGEGESDEKPVHSVTVSSFWMSKYEITQRQWESVMGSNPSKFKDCSDCPVEQVSWEDVQEFLRKLNARTGGNYRLPTEAEWEYAAGGGSGTRTRFGNGQDVLDASEANFYSKADAKQPYSIAGEYRGKTVKVGSFRLNGLGLYNMSGNVWEWCSDWMGVYSSAAQTNPTGAATGSRRVVRGGSWRGNPAYSRVAYRDDHAPSYRNYYVGFRVVSLQ